MSVCGVYVCGCVCLMVGFVCVVFVSFGCVYGGFVSLVCVGFLWVFVCVGVCWLCDCVLCVCLLCERFVW